MSDNELILRQNEKKNILDILYSVFSMMHHVEMLKDIAQSPRKMLMIQHLKQMYTAQFTIFFLFHGIMIIFFIHSSFAVISVMTEIRFLGATSRGYVDTEAKK